MDHMRCLCQLLDTSGTSSITHPTLLPLSAFQYEVGKSNIIIGGIMPGAGWFIGLEPFNLFSFIDLKSFTVLRQPSCYSILLSVGCFDKPFNLRMDVSF